MNLHDVRYDQTPFGAQVICRTCGWSKAVPSAHDGLNLRLIVVEHTLEAIIANPRKELNL